MTTQALTLPLDITWQRIGYSRDMIDTSFGNINLPAKWRSSLAVYSYVVPEEQTAESYPGARIVYLKLTSSITGWNPSEELRDAVDLDEIGDRLDDTQASMWEAIQSEGWAETYWPCMGAIAQIAVYPSQGDDIGPDDFPYIMDFEPKKRELYEAVSETGEFLSSSLENINVQKGTTKVKGTESTHTAKVSANYGVKDVWGVGGSYEYSKKYSDSDTTVDMKTTDSSREKRETTSFSTSFSQMYQLFNGYHLGTNRAVFAIAPRPHVASQSELADFNLINGQRKLEGIQEMFLVVHMPSKLNGICIQAALDTGHWVEDENEQSITCSDSSGPQLVVTRRVIRSCGSFDETGSRLIATPVGSGQPLDQQFGLDNVSNEWCLAEDPISQSSMAKLVAPGGAGIRTGIEIANQRNLLQKRIIGKMVSGFSAGNYRPRPFSETNTFLRLARLTARNIELDLSALAKDGYLSKGMQVKFKKAGISTIGDLFSEETDENRAVNLEELRELREKILGSVSDAARIRKSQRYSR